jgi:alkylated DNA repair dioxygenase AlkB
MARQLDLLSGAGEVAVDPSFAGLRRTELAHGAWIDYLPGWVTGHDRLFDELAGSVRWRHESRRMYDRVVDVPRQIAVLPTDGPMPPVIETMRRLLGERYQEDFVRVSLALYRDGADSVAPHGDTTARDMDEAVVATVSLGEPRRFLLKPTEGGSSRSVPLGRGDLLVMGGTCQRTWRHSVPKVAQAGPRMAVMFRPTW